MSCLHGPAAAAAVGVNRQVPTQQPQSNGLISIFIHTARNGGPHVATIPQRMGSLRRKPTTVCRGVTGRAQREFRNRHVAVYSARDLGPQSRSSPSPSSWSSMAGDWDDLAGTAQPPNNSRQSRSGSQSWEGRSADSSDDDDEYDDYDREEQRRQKGSGVGQGSSPAAPLLALAGAVGLELLVTGSLVITPLAGAALALLALPAASALGAAAAATREAEAVRRAEARVRAEMASRVPVTPPESAEWLGRLMGEIWEPFVQPLVLGENLGNWADKIRRMAPAGFELELVEMKIGRSAPQMSNFQVLSDPSTGRVTAVDCDLALDSSSIRAVVAGSGPLGKFTAALTGISMRARMRLLPIPGQRMMLFSFLETPQIDPRLTVKGPFLGQRDIPPIALLRSVMAATLADCLVEPRRAAISLDPEVLVGQPIDTIFNIYIESIQGLPVEKATAAGPSSSAALNPTTGSSGGSGGSSTGEDLAAGGAGGSAVVSKSQDQRRNGGARKDGPGTAAGSSWQAAGAEAEADDGSGGGATSMVAAASSAAVAAGEAVVEGAGAIASLVPGFTEVAAAVEGSGRKRRRRRLQVVAMNTDNKLQRSTNPVPYPEAASTSKTSSSYPSSSSAASSLGGVVPVHQLLRLNVGHKDGIFKLLVRELGRGGVAGSSSSAAVAAAAAAAPVAAAVSGSVSGVGASAAGSLGLLGSVSLHLAAAKDGTTLFWAAREGGEPVAVRWRPSDGPWRVTLPLESPTLGLPQQQTPPTSTGASGSGKAGVGGSATAAGSGGVRVDQASKVSSSSAEDGGLNIGNRSGSASRGANGGDERRLDGGGRNLDGFAAASAGPGGGSGATSSSSSRPVAGASATGDSSTSAASVDSFTGTGSGSRGMPSSPGASRSETAAGSGSNGAAPPTAVGGGPSVTLLLSTDPWVYKDATPLNAAAEGPRTRSLVLQVVEARELASNDWAGTCDPYVRITYDGRTYRTRTLYNAHTPVWQQTFVLPYNRSPIRPTVPARNRLTLSVFDSGVSRDDRLGAAVLNLDMASEHELQDRWVPLLGVESGWLRIRIAAVPYPPGAAPVRRMVQTLNGLTRGSAPLVQVVVMAARALSPRAAGQLLGMRDAYCNIVYGGERQVTPVVKQNQNPQWDFTALFGAGLGFDPDIQQQEPNQKAEKEQRKPESEAVSAPQVVDGAEAPQGGGQCPASASTPPNSHPRRQGSLSATAQGRPSRPQGSGVSAAAFSGDDSAPEEGPQPGTQSAAVTPAAGPKSSSLPPYPAVPGSVPGPASGIDPASSTSSSSTSGPSSPWPRSGSVADTSPASTSRAASASIPSSTGRRSTPRPDMLRFEVKDVDPVPPDDDLGFVELPLRDLLPSPGDAWQGWLPLRRGDGAELLVRVCRVEPLPLGQPPLRLAPLLDPRDGATQQPYDPARPQTQPGQPQGQGSQPQLGPTVAGPGGSVSGSGGGLALQPRWSGTSLSIDGGQLPLGEVERVLVDGLTEQVRAANVTAAQIGEDLRVRLGQVVIPQLQDWWSGTVRRTASALELPADQASTWFRKSGLSNWAAGLSANSNQSQSPQPQFLMPTTPPPVVLPPPGPQGAAAPLADDDAPQAKIASSGQGLRSTGAADSGVGPDSLSHQDQNGRKTGGEAITSAGALAGPRDGITRKRGGDGAALSQWVAQAWGQLLGPPPFQPQGKGEYQEQGGKEEQQQTGDRYEGKQHSETGDKPASRQQ